MNALLHVAGATPLYREWSLASFPDDTSGTAAVVFALEWLERYRAGRRENVLLYGPQGGGKTGLAWSAIRNLIETDLTRCKIKTFRDALDVIKDSFRRTEPTPEMKGLKRVPVLVLDDVGSEKPTEFARTELLGLVDYRHLHRLPTWFTSNFEPDVLAARLGHDEKIIGDRILSRMVAGAVQFRMDVPDRRL